MGDDENPSQELRLHGYLKDQDWFWGVGIRGDSIPLVVYTRRKLFEREKKYLESLAKDQHFCFTVEKIGNVKPV